MVAVDDHPRASPGRCALGKLEKPSGFFWVARDINALDGALTDENAVLSIIYSALSNLHLHIRSL
jgi:hypothetical protein